MLRNVTLYETATKRITANAYKSGRGELVFGLQEWEKDGDGFMSFAIFASWGPNIAREACRRATDGVVERFWQRHMPEAKALVAARVAVLEGAPAGCEGCDCADPTAMHGLAGDCGCGCHSQAEVVHGS